VSKCITTQLFFAANTDQHRSPRQRSYNQTVDQQVAALPFAPHRDGSAAAIIVSEIAMRIPDEVLQMGKMPSRHARAPTRFSTPRESAAAMSMADMVKLNIPAGSTDALLQERGGRLAAA